MSGDKQRIGQIIGIGAKMRSAREAKEASLADISAQLHIRENHLLALEQETFEDLPGDVYAIGFIRTYAGYLGLNAAEMVSRFKSVQQPDSVNEVTPSESEKKPISTALKIGLAVVCVIVFFIMWLIAAPDMPNQTNSEIGAVNNAPDNKNDKLPDVAKNKPKAAPVNEGAKLLETPPPTISPVPQQAETAQVPAFARDNIERDNTEKEIVISALTPLTPLIPLTPVVQKVEIRATQRTWMRLENADGKILFSSIIKVGERVELIDDGTYTLATRDAGGLELVVDGEAIGAIGRRGQILTHRRIVREDILARQP